ncbi:MAG: GntR family transcriptional regulator [Candidatus Latescibacter sp.]|nr:GntR family transcriptional regulator [Candidatus Latescibacter sp.]
MPILIDPNRPIYLQIMEEIKKRAVRGQYPPGSQLPSVREMAPEMRVNPNTIARVYTELEREGFVLTRRGQGSYITKDENRIECEREILAEAAVKRFVEEVTALDLQNGHRRELMEMIAGNLSLNK